MSCERWISQFRINNPEGPNIALSTTNEAENNRCNLVIPRSTEFPLFLLANQKLTELNKHYPPYLMRILCLHGHGTSPEVLEYQISALSRELDPGWEFVYISGEMETLPPG